MGKFITFIQGRDKIQIHIHFYSSLKCFGVKTYNA